MLLYCSFVRMPPCQPVLRLLAGSAALSKPTHGLLVFWFRSTIGTWGSFSLKYHANSWKLLSHSGLSTSWRWHHSEHALGSSLLCSGWEPVSWPNVPGSSCTHLAQLHWPRVTESVHFSEQVLGILPVPYNTTVLHTILGTKPICLCPLQLARGWHKASSPEKVLNQWILGPLLKLHLSDTNYPILSSF